MICRDEIITEVWKSRDTYAAKHHNNLNEMVADLRDRQKRSDRKPVDRRTAKLKRDLSSAETEKEQITRPRRLSMTNVQEIEKSILSLSRKDYEKLRRWFLERDWDEWDMEIEQDASSGKLDFLLQEAAEAKRSGTLRALSIA